MCDLCAEHGLPPGVGEVKGGVVLDWGQVGVRVMASRCVILVNDGDSIEMLTARERRASSFGGEP